MSLPDDITENVQNVIGSMQVNNISSLLNTTSASGIISRSAAAEIENITDVEAGTPSETRVNAFRSPYRSVSAGYRTLHSGVSGLRGYNLNDNGSGEQFSSANFTYVNSFEEITAELSSATRELTTVVVHWTATYNDQDIGSEEVHEWHLSKGWAGAGYHYIIRRDGRLQRARPLNRTGAHAVDNGFNNHTIGISMVGGINAPSGSGETSGSAESLLPAQYTTLDQFFRAFYNVFPAGQAWGHTDLDNKGKIDPGFDVATYVQNKFGKTNITSNPRATGPASSSQISKGMIA